MPQRSNAFQKLILFIEQQLADENATVRESVMLAPLDGGDEVEVDVLIESYVGRHRIRVALECRDHKRPATKEWVNELVGKYAVLPVDKVIAVSRSGYTRGARQRAVAGKVVLSTMKSVNEADWPAQLHGWRLALVEIDSRPHAVSITYRDESPPLRGAAFASAQICDADGRQLSTVIDDARNLYQAHARRRLGEWMGTQRELWTRAADDQPWIVSLDFQAHSRFIRGPEGRLHEMDKMIIEVACRISLRKPEPSFYEYEGAMVSTFAEQWGGNRVALSVLLDSETGKPRSLQARENPESDTGRAKRKLRIPSAGEL